MSSRPLYEKLQLFEELAREYQGDKPEPFKDKIIEIKRQIREINNRPSDREIVRSYGIDGYVVLIELPEGIATEEDAVEYFEDNEYIPTFYSAYDCTGRPFTSWYKICKRRNRFYAYHSVAFDV